MTGARSYTLKPVLRLCAAVSLVFWLAAFALCSTECLEHTDSNSDHVAQAAANHGQHDSDKTDNHDDSFCISLHSFAPSSDQHVLVKPNFGLNFAHHFITAAQIIPVTEPEATTLRQPPDREWRFTPEVCLGPAFRSHAPPSSSLV